MDIKITLNNQEQERNALGPIWVVKSVYDKFEEIRKTSKCDNQGLFLVSAVEFYSLFYDQVVAELCKSQNAQIPSGLAKSLLENSQIFLNRVKSFQGKLNCSDVERHTDLKQIVAGIVTSQQIRLAQRPIALVVSNTTGSSTENNGASSVVTPAMVTPSASHVLTTGSFSNITANKRRRAIQLPTNLQRKIIRLPAPPAVTDTTGSLNEDVNTSGVVRSSVSHVQPTGSFNNFASKVIALNSGSRWKESEIEKLMHFPSNRPLVRMKAVDKNEDCTKKRGEILISTVRQKPRGGYHVTRDHSYHFMQTEPGKQVTVIKPEVDDESEKEYYDNCLMDPQKTNTEVTQIDAQIANVELSKVETEVYDEIIVNPQNEDVELSKVKMEVCDEVIVDPQNAKVEVNKVETELVCDEITVHPQNENVELSKVETEVCDEVIMNPQNANVELSKGYNARDGSDTESAPSMSFEVSDKEQTDDKSSEEELGNNSASLASIPAKALAKKKAKKKAVACSRWSDEWTELSSSETEDEDEAPKTKRKTDSDVSWSPGGSEKDTDSNDTSSMEEEYEEQEEEQEEEQTSEKNKQKTTHPKSKRPSFKHVSEDWLKDLDLAMSAEPIEELTSTQCPKCSFSSKSIKDFSAHISEQHMEQLKETKNAICPLCGLLLEFSCFDQHFKMCQVNHEKYKMYLPRAVCFICFEKCLEGDTPDHLYNQHGFITQGFKLPPHECSFCQEIFSERMALVKHMKVEHLKRKLKFMAVCLRCMDVLPSFKAKFHTWLNMTDISCLKTKHCEECKKDFSEYRYKDHVNKKHTEPLQQEHYKCVKCGEVALKRFDVIHHNHLKHPENRFINQSICIRCCKTHQLCECPEVQQMCPYCGKTVSKKVMQKHIYASHEYAICSICGATMLKPRLRFHQLSHKHDTKTKCPFCKRLILDRRLEKHIASAHKKTQTFPCTYEGCKKKLATKHSLRVHLRTHTNEAHLSCKLCEYTCKQRNALNWHMRSKHKGAGL